MNCWHCGTMLILGGDHNIEDENGDRDERGRGKK